MPDQVSLPQDASASTKAIVYQLCVAVEKCFEMTRDQKVLIDTQGDVTVSEVAQIEVKKYSDNLTDNHANFWKTLSNWMNDGFEPTNYANLILYTTQPFGQQSTLVKWNESDCSERLRLLQDIYEKNEDVHRKRVEASTSTPPKPSEVLVLQRKILSPETRSKLNNVLERFAIEATSPDLSELYTKIQDRFVKGILNAKRPDFLNSLIGFICTPPTVGEYRWEITFDSFSAKVGDLQNTYCHGTKIFPQCSTSAEMGEVWGLR